MAEVAEVAMDAGLAAIPSMSHGVLVPVLVPHQLLLTVPGPESAVPVLPTSRAERDAAATALHCTPVTSLA